MMNNMSGMGGAFMGDLAEFRKIIKDATIEALVDFHGESGETDELRSDLNEVYKQLSETEERLEEVTDSYNSVQERSFDLTNSINELVDDKEMLLVQNELLSKENEYLKEGLEEFRAVSRPTEHEVAVEPVKSEINVNSERTQFNTDSGEITFPKLGSNAGDLDEVVGFMKKLGELLDQY